MSQIWSWDAEGRLPFRFHALFCERFHGYLTNYRGDGTKYQVEIDCRPLYNGSGGIEGFISFQREVLRRVGRPAKTSGGRYETNFTSNDLLSDALRNLGIFSSGDPYSH